MKAILHKIIVTLFIGLLMVFSSTTSYGLVKYRVIQDGCLPQLQVYVDALTNYTSPPNNTWTLGKFVIRWDQAYGQNLLTAVSSSNGFTWFFDGPVQADNGNSTYFQAVSFTADVILSMTAGNSYLMATVTLGNSNAFVDFEIPASDNLGASPLVNFNNTLGNQHQLTYTVSQAIDVNCVPAVVWDGVVWCGGSGTAFAPNTTDGAKPCLIKGTGAVILEDAAILSLTVREIGTISVDDGFDMVINGPITLDYDGVNAGTLTIDPDATVSASGATSFSGPSQIKVLADGNGVGSFIDNGTINQTNGSADVQIYLTNAGGVGSYYLHQVGPTVNNPVYQSAFGHPGVYLGQFDIITLGTYAYRYLESTNAWENIYPVWTPVPLTQGLILSTIDNTNHQLTMTGQLNTGNITTPFNLGHSGANIDLISNPYPSAIDFDVFQGDNTGVVNTTYYIYNPANGSGTYETYTIGSGGLLSGEIQVGQGFFVETNTAGSVQFQNDQRLHSTSAFIKDYYANQLRIDIDGFDFGDAAFVHFKENATAGHDYTMDATKWFSVFEEATELWTISADMSALTMNAMPMLDTEPVSIPMNYKGGFEGEYTLTASQLESFPSGTQVFLEDLLTGSNWINLMENPVYTFTGSPEDDQARFVLHFFGPTGIGEDGMTSLVKIYSSKEYAYILNNSDETLREYVVYDMTGRPVASGSLSNSTLNRIYVSDITGYYLVKVSSGENVYNAKVYISR